MLAISNPFFGRFTSYDHYHHNPYKFVDEQSSIHKLLLSKEIPLGIGIMAYHYQRPHQPLRSSSHFKMRSEFLNSLDIFNGAVSIA